MPGGDAAEAVGTSVVADAPGAHVRAASEVDRVTVGEGLAARGAPDSRPSSELERATLEDRVVRTTVIAALERDRLADGRLELGQEALGSRYRWCSLSLNALEA